MAYIHFKIQCLYLHYCKYSMYGRVVADVRVKSAWRSKLCPQSQWKLSCNISKTSASVSSGVPNTEKVMKARGRRPSAFIVSRCLEPLMKHEARDFDMASQMKQQEIMQWHVFANETIRNYAVLNISPFPKERVCMHDSLASNHERGRSGTV